MFCIMRHNYNKYTSKNIMTNKNFYNKSTLIDTLEKKNITFVMHYFSQKNSELLSKFCVPDFFSLPW